ncbi:SprT-like domain-containing protein [Desulfosarcina sp.]|uniref:SprT-like domain-containing protein n=1 Tax=Desulfosarcina sp. TaxID=2027861 RepID=UPI003970EE23
MTADLKQLSIWDDPPAAPDAGALRSSFEHRVLRGLVAEWENALWLLPDSLQRAVRKPFFAIRNLPGRLGCWSPEKREITLSREMVDSGRWDDIKEVLLHEMAHQVAHEGLRATSEKDHGEHFRQACRLLRANPSASGTYLPLHTRLQQGESLDNRDRIVVKIHKLMALAESSNPNEAHAAMRKAHELISRHNVELIGRGADQDYHSVFLGAPRRRHFRETYHLADLLQEFYFVQGMWIQAWVLEKACMGRVLEISGTLKNVQIAEYIHAAVCRYIENAWADYRRGKALTRYRQTDFSIGIIEGFKTTLQQARTAAAGSRGAQLPVRIEDHALARYVDQRYPHVRAISGRVRRHDPRVLADGTEQGKKMIIAKGITRSDGFKERVLEYKHES